PPPQIATGSPIDFAETSHMATLQPSAISWRASSRPMPVPPPVTTAKRPAKSFMSFPLVWASLPPASGDVHRDLAGTGPAGEGCDTGPASPRAGQAAGP